MKNKLTITLLTLLVAFSCEQKQSKPLDGYDVVILNGRVMDPETNFDGIRNVGIKGDRIEIITEETITGAKTIDAKGLAVVPGFINTHNHSFAPFDTRLMAHDGITTLLDTEGGVANANFFYNKYQGKAFVNYGTGISHEEVRRVVLDGVEPKDASDPTGILVSRGIAQQDNHASWALDEPTKEQFDQILTMYEQGMLDGAICVNSTVGYMGYGVQPWELFTLQKLAKKHDRFFGAHTRFGPTEQLPRNFSLGAREVIANAVALDGALLLSHIQNQNWWEIYELANRLQKQGMTIFAEYYPAVTGSPNIATPQLMPDKLTENQMDPTKTIINPDTGELFESDEAFFKMQRESPEKMIFVIIRNPEWMKQWPHMKDIAIASDAIAYYDPEGNLLPFEADPSEYGGHPRNAWTSAFVYSEARKQDIPLMDIVNNTSYIPAKYFSKVGLKALQERGRMQEGMIADITMFDPETIAPSSTMKVGERGLFSKGIPHVMVSGQLIIENGKTIMDVKPGKPIRYAKKTGVIKLDYDDKQYQWHAKVKKNYGQDNELIE